MTTTMTTTMIKRSTRLKPSRIKPKPKTAEAVAKKLAHVYGSEARVKWVQQLPCAACGEGPCDNHHVRTGGKGLKAHHSCVMPLCQNCHRVLLPSHGAITFTRIQNQKHGGFRFERRRYTTMDAVAAAVDAAWILFEGGLAE